MIRRYLPDVLFLLAAISAAFFLAETPQLTHRTAVSPPEVLADAKAPPSASQTRKEDDEKTGKRNIFSWPVRDREPVRAPAPENPYVLLGVVQEGAARKAMFRDHTGNVIKADTARPLPDDSRITEMTDSRVVLQKEHLRKTFHIYSPTPSPAFHAGAPVRPPVLVGILEGAEKQAVFRDHDGHLAVLQVKQTLPDGSVVSRIDSRSVRLKTGKEEKDMAVYAAPIMPIPEPAPQMAQEGKKPEKSAETRRKRPRPRVAAEENDEGGGS